MSDWQTTGSRAELLTGGADSSNRAGADSDSREAEGAARNGRHDAKRRTAQRTAPVDVWSRTEPKYRIRAIVLLLVNLVLFCGLCVFTHWLHFARPFDFTWASYVEPVSLWGTQTQNLNDFVLYPISVEQNPMHGVVLGLLVASIVAIPISVAILYRFPYALPFVAAVLLFAHMPWMAFTLFWACLLASVRPFRLSWRYGAALVGMLPVLIYLYLATRPTADQMGAYASPEQKLLLAAPWILAIIASCLMMGAILIIARIVNYRPGAVPPVMAIMFATPTVLFHAYVGLDEVSYRVLQAEFGPRAKRFAPQDLTAEAAALMREQLDETTLKEFLPTFANPEPFLELRERFIQRLLRDFLEDRRAAREALQRFIADYPKSRYVPCALYMQGWILDLRLDLRATMFDQALRRELYSDYPHVQSEAPWLALLTSYPQSPLTKAARLRLAQLRLRDGQVDAAVELLTALLSEPPAPTTQLATQPAPRPWERRRPLEDGLGFEAEPYRFAARRLLELIQANRTDPEFGDEPLEKLASLDPRRPHYRRELLRLAAAYEGSLLEDNLLVLWAESAPDRAERYAAYEACLAAFPAGDARAHALFGLAEMEAQARTPGDAEARQRGFARLTELAQAPTHWGDLAQRLLRRLPTAPAPDAPAPQDVRTP